MCDSCEPPSTGHFASAHFKPREFGHACSAFRQLTLAVPPPFSGLSKSTGDLPSFFARSLRAGVLSIAALSRSPPMIRHCSFSMGRDGGSAARSESPIQQSPNSALVRVTSSCIRSIPPRPGAPNCEELESFASRSVFDLRNYTPRSKASTKGCIPRAALERRSPERSTKRSRTYFAALPSALRVRLMMLRTVSLG